MECLLFAQVPAALAAAGAAVQGALSRALARCEGATGLAGLRELRGVAEEELAAFLARFQVLLNTIFPHARGFGVLLPCVQKTPGPF